MPGPKPHVFIMAAIHARELATAEIATALCRATARPLWGRPRRHLAARLQRNPHPGPVQPRRPQDGRDRRRRLPSSPTRTCSGARTSTTTCAPAAACTAWTSTATAASAGTAARRLLFERRPLRLVYHGPAPASEPETQAHRDLYPGPLSRLRGPANDDAAPVDTQGLMISLHSYGSARPVSLGLERTADA